MNRTTFSHRSQCLAWAVALLLLALQDVTQAQFSYTTNNGTITVTRYTGSGGAVSIPAVINGLPVTGIGNSAFFDKGLTAVTIPDSVTNIGGYAFYGCASLTNVTIGNGITSIGEAAFENCFSLTSVYFIGNAPGVDPSAFSTKILGGNDEFFYGLDPAIIYYLPGTTSWSDFSTNTDMPAVLWLPRVQTGDGNLGAKNNQFGFTISWASAQTVVVEACANLSNPVWIPISTNALVDGVSYFSDPQPANLPGRFYRLRSP